MSDIRHITQLGKETFNQVVLPILKKHSSGAGLEGSSHHAIKSSVKALKQIGKSADAFKVFGRSRLASASLNLAKEDHSPAYGIIEVDLRRATLSRCIAMSENGVGHFSNMWDELREALKGMKRETEIDILAMYGVYVLIIQYFKIFEHPPLDLGWYIHYVRSYITEAHIAYRGDSEDLHICVKCGRKQVAHCQTFFDTPSGKCKNCDTFYYHLDHNSSDRMIPLTEADLEVLAYTEFIESVDGIGIPKYGNFIPNARDDALILAEQDELEEARALGGTIYTPSMSPLLPPVNAPSVMDAAKYEKLLRNIYAYIDLNPDRRRDLFFHYFGVDEDTVPSIMNDDLRYMMYLAAKSDVQRINDPLSKSYMSRVYFDVEPDMIPSAAPPASSAVEEKSRASSPYYSGLPIATSPKIHYSLPPISPPGSPSYTAMPLPALNPQGYVPAFSLPSNGGLSPSNNPQGLSPSNNPQGLPIPLSVFTNPQWESPAPLSPSSPQSLPVQLPMPSIPQGELPTALPLFGIAQGGLPTALPLSGIARGGLPTALPLSDSPQ